MQERPRPTTLPRATHRSTEPVSHPDSPARARQRLEQRLHPGFRARRSRQARCTRCRYPRQLLRPAAGSPPRRGRPISAGPSLAAGARGCPLEGVARDRARRRRMTTLRSGPNADGVSIRAISRRCVGRTGTLRCTTCPPNPPPSQLTSASPTEAARTEPSRSSTMGVWRQRSEGTTPRTSWPRRLTQPVRNLSS